MANIENVEMAIKVMEGVGSDELDMRSWFGDCGTVACFAGHLALSDLVPEIKGGIHGDVVHSEDESIHGVAAIAKFLDIPLYRADEICGIDISMGGWDSYAWDNFYDKESDKIQPKDVILALEDLL